MKVVPKIGAVLLLGVTLFFLSQYAIAEIPGEELRCQSVTDVDLLNAKIDRLQYTKGRACTSDNLPDKCDWEHKITRDEIFRLSPSREVRLVVINSNHLTGSGAWDAVVVFDCVDGLMKEMFEKSHLYGERIEHTGKGELVFVSGKWAKGDPMCCPSEVRSEVYRWDEMAGTFNLVDTIIRKK